MKKFLLRIACALIVFALSDCAAPLKTDYGRLAITVSTGDGSRRSSLELDTEVKNYDVFGAGPGAAFFSRLELGKGSHAVTGLAAGEWIISAVGKNEGKDEIVEAWATVEVKGGETASVALTCVPITGDGILDLNVGWPASLVPQPEVTAYLIAGDTDDEGIYFDMNGTTPGMTTATATSTTHPDGYYFLSIVLRDRYSDGPAIWEFNEEVRILRGTRTTGSWILDEEGMASGGIGISVDGAPIAVTLSGGIPELLEGYPQTIAASANADPVSWRWYLDARPVPDAEGYSANLVLNTSELRGGYRLSALAGKGRDLGSRSFAFFVHPNDSDMAAFSHCLAGYACNGAEVGESSKGVYTLASGPGDTTKGDSELVGRTAASAFDGGPYCGGKAYLGIPVANEKALTNNFRVSFKRTIDSHPASITNPSACMYINLIVDGNGVENTNGGTGVLVAATPAADVNGTVVLDMSTPINGIYGGTISEVAAKDPLQKLVDKGLFLVNAVTNDNGTPIDRKLAAVLIIVGDSRGIKTDGGNMSKVVMTVSDVQWTF